MIPLYLNHDFQGSLVVSSLQFTQIINHSYGKSPFLMGKSTISMAIFNSFLYVYQRVIRNSHGEKHHMTTFRHAQIVAFSAVERRSSPHDRKGPNANARLGRCERPRGGWPRTVGF